MNKQWPRLLRLLGIVLVGGLLLAFQAGGFVREVTVLYDGRLGGTPDQQELSYIALFATAASQRFAGDATILDTLTEISDQAGYFAPSSLTLDRELGYSVQFTGQLLNETHSSQNRAGFTLLVLSDDLLGLELALWEDEIWAQEGGSAALFTHAEGAAFDTTAARVAYELLVQGDTYRLTADGTTILSGPLRDYTAFEGFPDVYETPNLLFMGDNTRRGAAEVAIALVAVERVLPATRTPRPTATSLPTATASSTPTLEPPPTATPTSTPTQTATASPTATPQPTARPTRWFFWWLPWLR